MQDVVIVGAGGLGREVLTVFRACNQANRKWNIVGFLDSDESRWGSDHGGLPVIGGDDWWKTRPATHLICAIGNTRRRHMLVESFRSAGARFCSAVHPSVELSDDVSIGDGTVIMAGARFSANARIGSHVTIYLNCSITHDVQIGDYSLVASGCSLAGHVVVGTGVELGTSVCAIPSRKIGDWSIIGAGSVVTRDVPSRVVAAGVPCRVLRTV